MAQMIERLAEVVNDTDTLESLTRALLELLESVTGLESTYLTRIDEIQNLQQVLFARNSGALQIPEGLSVPWGDTLCKRALDEQCFCVADVPGRWGDSEAARALGIQTYVSVPVRSTDGHLLGTLCAASQQPAIVAEASLKILGLFARLIAFHAERERTLQSLNRRNDELSSHALVDALTGLANRRALLLEVQRLLSQMQRQAFSPLMAFIDLDGFKTINDRYGHQTGDQFLAHIANRLLGAVRRGDFVARYGGDEFVVITQSGDEWELAERLATLIRGHWTHGAIDIDYQGASIGVIRIGSEDRDAEALLARADARMYEIKQARRLAY